jgi:hypothetical protein
MADEKKTLVRARLTGTKVRDRLGKVNIDPQTPVRIIAKVNTAGYVPANVRLRTQIDAHLFTADCAADELASLESDPQIESIEVSQPLPTQDPGEK